MVLLYTSDIDHVLLDEFDGGLRRAVRYELELIDEFICRHMGNGLRQHGWTLIVGALNEQRGLLRLWLKLL